MQVQATFLTSSSRGALPDGSNCSEMALGVVRMPRVELGSMASEATTLSIVLHPQEVGREISSPGRGRFARRI
jgi:hypothetical protein